jgi:hypothetical protein
MNLTSAAIADQALSSAGINAVADSELRVHTQGSVTLAGTLVDAPSIKLSPKIAYVPHRTPAGTNTIKQWVRNRVAPALEGEFTIPYDDTTWSAFRDAQTARALFYQIGSTVSRGAVLISVPTMRFKDWQRVPIDSIAGQRLPFYAQLDNQTTTNSNNLQKSAFRIHCF